MMRALLIRTPRRPAGKRRGVERDCPTHDRPAAARTIRRLASTDPSIPFVRAADINRATGAERARDGLLFIIQLVAVVLIGCAFFWGAVVAWAAT